MISAQGNSAPDTPEGRSEYEDYAPSAVDDDAQQDSTSDHSEEALEHGGGGGDRGSVTRIGANDSNRLPLQGYAHIHLTLSAELRPHKRRRQVENQTNTLFMLLTKRKGG